LSRREEVTVYASITHLETKSEEAAQAAAGALERLLADARADGGVPGCYVVRTGGSELTMITIYESEAASNTASEQLRPKLSASVGPM
jgi:hypothetical protein